MSRDIILVLIGAVLGFLAALIMDLVGLVVDGILFVVGKLK